MQISKASLPYLFISVVTLVLASHQAVVAFASAGHDDFLFLQQAISIAKGQWLGDYHNLTHAKGPGFPIFLALNFYFGLPIIMSQQFLYLSSIALLVLSIKPFTNRLTRIIVFAILAFNPYFLVWLRITREPLYTIETIAVTACVIALLTQIYLHPKLLEGDFNDKTTNLLYWQCGLGFFYGTFWVTREERIWLAPVILLLLVSILYIAESSVTSSRINFTKILFSVGRFILPTVFCLLITLLPILILNQTYYGFWGVTDTKTNEFRSAYGSLTRVEDEGWHPYVPVSQEVREKLYGVSPAFRELKPYLEDTLVGWSENGCALYQICDDIAGGWFLWAFRDAIQLAGHFESHEKLLSYLGVLTDEISEACDTNEIDCGSLKKSLSPRINSNYLRRFPASFLMGFQKLLLLKGQYQGNIEQEVANRASFGPSDRFQTFEIFLHSRIFPMEEGESHPEIGSTIHRFIISVYQVISPLIALGMVFHVIGILLFRKVPLATLISMALIAAVLLRMAILTLIQLSLFPGFQNNYLIPATPLLYVSGILGYVEFGRLCLANPSVNQKT